MGDDPLTAHERSAGGSAGERTDAISQAAVEAAARAMAQLANDQAEQVGMEHDYDWAEYVSEARAALAAAAEHMPGVESKRLRARVAYLESQHGFNAMNAIAAMRAELEREHDEARAERDRLREAGEGVVAAFTAGTLREDQRRALIALGDALRASQPDAEEGHRA